MSVLKVSRDFIDKFEIPCVACSWERAVEQLDPVYEAMAALLTSWGEETVRRHEIGLNYAFENPIFLDKISGFEVSLAIDSALRLTPDAGFGFNDAANEAIFYGRLAEDTINAKNDYLAGQRYLSTLSLVESLSSAALHTLLKRVAPPIIRDLAELGVEGLSASLAWLTAYLVGFSYGVE